MLIKNLNLIKSTQKMVAPFMVAAFAFGSTMMIADQAKAETLLVGTEGAYAPFNYLDKDGNLVGFDIDIAKAVCAEMKRECTFVTQDWDGIIPALLAKKFDTIVASMSITEDRQKVIDFSRPYYTTPAKFVARDGAFPDDSQATLKGKRIGAQRASIHQGYAEDMYPDSKIVLYATQEELYLDLVADRIDAGMADSIAILDGFINTDAGKGFSYFGGDHKSIKHHGFGVGMAVRKEDTALRDELSRAIEAIHANGTYQKINDSYFNFSVWTDGK